MFQSFFFDKNTNSHCFQAPISQIKQECPFAPLLFALAVEPLSQILKATMSGMHIDHIHVKQNTLRTVVAMCTGDTTIFAGGLEAILHTTFPTPTHLLTFQQYAWLEAHT